MHHIKEKIRKFEQNNIKRKNINLKNREKFIKKQLLQKYRDKVDLD